MDLTTATTIQTLRALQDKEISSVELLAAMVDRIERFNPQVNAVVEQDLEQAMVEAAAADDERMTDDRLGPLHGLPMTVKDTWETADLTTTAGAPELKEHVPERDADVIRMLRRDGAIVWAKTNVPLLAGDHQSYNKLHGITRNPWNLERTAGGSSGGAAVAVACGFTTAEIGSDIGGSIRQPAAFNGVFGLKTTHGLVSGRGHVPGMPETRRLNDLGVYGPIARSCGDLRLLLESITRSRSFVDSPNARLNRSKPDIDVADLRVGVWADDPVAPVDSSITAAIEAAAADLGAAGARIDMEIRPTTSSAELHEIYSKLLSSETVADQSDDQFNRLVEIAASGKTGLAAESARRATMSHRDWIKADEARWQIEEEWYRLFESVDVVIAPVAPCVAFPHDTETSYFNRTLTVNGEPQPYAGLTFWSGIATMPLLPAVTVPIGMTDDGLPIGMQVIGPRWSEYTLLDIAEEFASVLGQQFTPPPLVK